jgi:UDP-GlcNAc3NAcA epimerase
MPEEINHVLTDHISILLFAPTTTAVTNLAKEGIAGEAVQLVGDVMYDVALFYGEKAERESKVLAHLELMPKGYVLATVHRAENTDKRERQAAILKGFGAYGHTIILPLHPRTRESIASFDILLSANIKVIDPIGYFDMVMLEKTRV